MTGVALTVMEKAVQRHYERMLRPAEKPHAPWIDPVMGQLSAGLAALNGELPASGWISGEFGPRRHHRCLRFRLHPLFRSMSSTPAGIRISRRSPPAPKRFPHFAPPAGGWRDPLHDRRLTKREPLSEQSGRN